MLLVPCPHCGPRNAADLRYVGETTARPDPTAVEPEAWRGYLYLRDNPAGRLTEMWYCRSGCRRYFTLERDTVTNEFDNSPLPFPKGSRS
ncbi:MAG: sarcosine oxidase subunit delta [Acidimicrobiia bacterium]|nr:sarcosine oxidase subunit delta [Acidimicrobiia bacterium]MDH5521194.1 sarcosine oxidase subunit delta [Acidimicrobiia bacterium]